MEHFMNTEAPVPPTTADLADFEAYIARQTRGWAQPERAALEAFLRAHPGMSVADWKGKGLSAPLDAAPRETPWPRLKLAEVREEATATIARDLPRNVRRRRPRPLRATCPATSGRPLAAIPALSGTRWRASIACACRATPRGCRK